MKTPDPLEEMVAAALLQLGIRFERESARTLNLDFYLPDHGIYIEVKGGHSLRIAEQMSRASSVIAIQGLNATKLFCQLISNQQKLSH